MDYKSITLITYLSKEIQYTMPIIQSAKKRVRVAKKAAVANAKTKRAVRNAIKNVEVAASNKKDTTKAQAEAYSALDTAVKKNVISKNKAARKKAQINAVTKAAGTTKVGTKKAAAKKPAATKKAPAKKTAAKKAPAKKPAAKKTAAKK